MSAQFEEQRQQGTDRHKARVDEYVLSLAKESEWRY